ncbi:MAG: choice-of-anchor A family protein [Fibrobacterota bacterium]
MNVKALNVFVLCLGVAAVQASLLGVAGEYNIFSFGDVIVKWSDSEGKVAGQGDVNVESYRIGAQSDPSLHSLVGGGDVTFKYGEIHNGGIYAGGGTKLTGATVHGDIHVGQNLDVFSGGTYDGNFVVNGTADVPGYLSHKVNYGDPGDVPVDFSAAYTNVSNLSHSLASQATSGSIEKNGNAVTLKGNDLYNYFHLTSQDVSNLSSLTLDLGEGAVAYINVSGTKNSLGDFDLFDGEGDVFTNSESLLFNFYQADYLTLAQAGIRGSILAMDADVDFNNAYADGNVVVGSISGYGEFHSGFFRSPQDVPEPEVLAFLGVGGTMFLGFIAGKRKTE